MHIRPFVAKRKRRELPYWLAAGEELCTGCERAYAYAVEARCVSCDRAYCSVCVYVVAGERFCRDCHEEKGGSRWRRVRSGKV